MLLTERKYTFINGGAPKGKGIWWFRFYRVKHNGGIVDLDTSFVGSYASAKRQAAQRIASEGWNARTVVELLP